jgi:hypothetical protein
LLTQIVVQPFNVDGVMEYASLFILPAAGEAAFGFQVYPCSHSSMIKLMSMTGSTVLVNEKIQVDARMLEVKLDRDWGSKLMIVDLKSSH